MAKERMSLICVMLFVLSISGCLLQSEAANTKQSYVVYMGSPLEDANVNEADVEASHYELLGSVLGSYEAARESMFYSYTKNINGFAARLDEEQARALSQSPGVLSVFPNRAKQLHTTDSWRFLGLEGPKSSKTIPTQSLWQKAKFGADVIIANLDTGVWPESPSFSDRGIGPIPSRWRGACQEGTKFGPANCNRKLIGAKYFIKGYEAANGPLNESATGNYLSPRDKEGHGSHTLSTAGGSFVSNASVFGFAEGTAKGGAPHARVAAYKVCWPPTSPIEGSCYDADILAAFEAAIHDGVDVISVSLGSGPPIPDFFEDGIAIGSFHAVQRGKVVVASAGNSGPDPGTVSNVEPWIITVAASSINRNFPSTVLLGNKKTYQGQSLSDTHLPKPGYYPLVSSADATAPGANASAGQLCFPGGLDPRKVKGKIVACLRGENSRVEKGEAVSIAGGIGMILCNAPEDADEIVADAHVLPATHLNADDGQEVLDYISKTKSPVAYISPAKTVLNSKPAPVMTAFSSQGPNTLLPDLLKPDITAPGLNILAAYSEAASPTDLDFDKRRVAFNIVSGTSMSCPHVAGIAASIKAAHPTWSPSAIKSAIMTTASRMDNTYRPVRNASMARAGPFNYGAGHVDPNAAANPGLVYDLSNKDFYLFFCGLNYTSSQLKTLTGHSYRCPLRVKKTYELNYPSITVAELRGSVFLKRTVTNVGEEASVYVAKVRPPTGVKVTVWPTKLQFSQVGEKLSFTVKLEATRKSRNYVGGTLTWTDGGRHVVVSPIVVNNAVPVKHQDDFLP